MLPASPPTLTNKGFYIQLFCVFRLITLSFIIGIGTSTIVHAKVPEMPGPGSEETPLKSNPHVNKPLISQNPTMSEKGAVLYWNLCLSCHGDKGQGLTDEWRRNGFGDDFDCWKSNCHATNLPKIGFNFPSLVPPLIGRNTLLRFTTARELKIHIQSAMPWWDSGSLSENDSWNLTAFILRENGALPAKGELTVQTADLAPVHLPIRDLSGDSFGQSLLLTVLSLTSVGLILAMFFNRPEKNNPRPGSGRPNFFYHLHPPTIPLPQARWRYTLGAGGLAIFLTLIIIATGALELFFYTPTPALAGPSIQMITFLVPFGGFVRGLHFWASQALVVISGIHLLRVIFTEAYHPPRRFNFILGLSLFVLVIFLDFTGYILRWDNGIHWALIVGTNLLGTIPIFGSRIYQFAIGGLFPGPATLIRFYAWHIFGLTLALVIVIIWHIFRIRRDGGISAPDPDQRIDLRRITRYELVKREILAMMIASVVMILIATLVPAPLSSPILDASIPINSDVRAPWFFLWVQQLLRHGDAFLMGVVIPIIVLIFLGSLPYLFPQTSETKKGEWFPASGRIAQIIVAILALGWLVLTILELLK